MVLLLLLLLLLVIGWNGNTSDLLPLLNNKKASADLDKKQQPYSGNRQPCTSRLHDPVVCIMSQYEIIKLVFADVVESERGERKVIQQVAKDNETKNK